MDREFKIPWVDISWVGGENTMGWGLDVPWIWASIYLGRGSRYHG